MTTAAAVLFKPADAIAVVQGDDNGTPWQKDEPQAENAPDGAAIDYYLKSARAVLFASRFSTTRAAWSGPFRATIPRRRHWRRRTSRSSGARGRTCCRAMPATIAGSGICDRRRCPSPGADDGGLLPMLTGTFTVRLTANGQTYTQPLVVRSDPRTR